jgi:hypothetical protein
MALGSRKPPTVPSPALVESTASSNPLVVKRSGRDPDMNKMMAAVQR